MQEKVKEEFLQARKVVNEAILLDQQSATRSCLLELLNLGRGMLCLRVSLSWRTCTILGAFRCSVVLARYKR